MTNRRTLPLALTVPIHSGSDPDVISVGGNKTVYELWPEIDTPCEQSPVGQCEYLIGNPDICIHCKKATGA